METYEEFSESAAAYAKEHPFARMLLRPLGGERDGYSNNETKCSCLNCSGEWRKSPDGLKAMRLALLAQFLSSAAQGMETDLPSLATQSLAPKAPLRDQGK